MSLRDPVLHSHISDRLPDDHELAFTTVTCRECGKTLHATNNECMRTWIESGWGNHCLPCFVKEPDCEALSDDYALGQGDA